MKEHVTQCNRVAQGCVFIHIRFQLLFNLCIYVKWQKIANFGLITIYKKQKRLWVVLWQMYIQHISPHTYPPLAAAHSLNCFPRQQLSGPHCHRCPLLNGFGFGCYADPRLEGEQTGSWVAGWAPGAVPGSLPLLLGPAVLRPAARWPRPPALMTGLPMETVGGASLWERETDLKWGLTPQLDIDHWWSLTL